MHRIYVYITNAKSLHSQLPNTQKQALQTFSKSFLLKHLKQKLCKNYKNKNTLILNLKLPQKLL